MRPSKQHAPFTLYKNVSKNETIWYARFWNSDAGRYSVTRSTGVPVMGKKQRRDEALIAAQNMLPSIRFTPSVADTLFLDYVEQFWTPNSPYVRDRALVAKKPLSVEYIQNNHDDIGRHARPFHRFSGLKLKDLTPGMIQDWMRWAAAGGLSGRRINAVLQAMRIAVRYAVRREDIPRDPFALTGEAAEQPRQKGVLTQDEAARLIQTEYPDPRIRCAVFLGFLCGMRLGEVRGLEWQDIDTVNKIIHIQHNYIDGEGIKAPKCGSTRTVPLTEPVRQALDAIRSITPYSAPDSFVIFTVNTVVRPSCDAFIRNGFIQFLSVSGISAAEQKQRNITFHSLRHTFVTLGRLAGISDFAIQALAGHKSASMMEHYSHAAQVIDFNEARRKLEQAEGLTAAGGSV
jgi:integrase